MLHSICQQIWKTQQWPQDWKRSVFIPIPKKGNAKECPNYCTIAVISHTCKVMLKILQVWLQEYVNCELPDAQDGFRKGRGTRYQIASIRWIIEKATAFHKNIYFCLIHYAKVFVWITRNCGKFCKRWEYQTIWPASWEICMKVKKQQLELGMEQWTSSIGKGVCQGCILSPCLFNLYAEHIMQNAGWMKQKLKHKLESKLLEEILITSYMYICIHIHICIHTNIYIYMYLYNPSWQKVKN